MTRYALLLVMSAAIAVISGCAPSISVPETVRVEVSVPCVAADKIPQRPQVRNEADLLRMDRFTRTLAAWQDLKRWEAYAEQLAALVAGCSALPPG